MNDDLISREAVKKFINEVCFSKEWAKYRADYGSRGQIDCILTYIDNAPTVEEPERPQGEWIDHKLRDDIVVEHAFKCSRCKQDSGLYYPTDFCPNCGAAMRNGGEGQ